MENIILTNNKDLRLVGVKVGVYSTLRFELPLVSASATNVEVIVTSGGVHSAYTATYVESTKCWQCDIAATQFPEVGKQSYEVAYVLDGKQFWDGKGWIEIEDATTSGIEPQPHPEPYRYVVLSVNGYGADSQGAVRIPKTFISTDSPTTTEGYMEGDIYFNRLTGAMWTLCNVQSTLTWVFNYSNYYTKSETDEQIDKLAAYYITSDVQGNPFATHAALVNAQTYYSGGSVRVPTRNDYAVVLADETHSGAEWRYIYAVADGQTTGQWEPQYPIETNDYTALSNKPQINGVTLTGNKTGSDLGLKNNFIIGRGLQEVSNDLYAYKGADGTSTEGQTVYTLGAVAEVGSELYTWDGTTLTDTHTSVSSINVGTGRIYTSLVPPVYYDRSAEDDVSRPPPTVKVVTVAPSTTAQEGDVADAKSVWDELMKLAPDWTIGASYTQYDVVKYNGTYYYAKRNIAANTAWSESNWGSLANLAALAHLFLPLTGGTVTGDLTVTYGSDGFKVQDANGDYVRFYHGTVAGNYWYIEYSVNGVGTGALRLPYEDIIPVSEKAIAQEFNQNSTYAVDDVVMHEGLRYKCTTAVTTAGAWTGSINWIEDTVDNALEALRTAVADKVNKSGDTMTGSLTLPGISLTNGVIVYDNNVFNLVSYGGGTLALMGQIAPDYSASSAYVVGQLAVRNDILVRCTTAGTGSAAIFTPATVEDVLAALRTALAGKAPIASPAFTGTPTAPTPTAGDNSTKIATTAFVQGRIGQKLEVWLSVNPQTGVVSANYDDGL